jgi:hypothetical protein
VQIESTRTLEIDQFVPRSEIDDRYVDSPYYLAPDGKVGQDPLCGYSRHHVFPACVAPEPRGCDAQWSAPRIAYRDRMDKIEDQPPLCWRCQGLRSVSGVPCSECNGTCRGPMKMEREPSK